METDKVLISILMAVYNPRLDWLKEQLDSLNKQTYPNIELIICDDDPDNPVDEDIFAELITSFSWRLIRNEVNLGSNKTFEKMTALAAGKYICYCDQDDIWLPEKTERLLQTIRAENAELVCSDMYIIDSDGKQTADSITKIRRHHIFRSGFGLTDTLWHTNFASGCALMVNASSAKSAIPYNPYMVYDHYITLFCANRGKVVSLMEPLLKHREHGENQTSVLQGVSDRESYYKIRVEVPMNAVNWLCKNFEADAVLIKTLKQADEWLKARFDYGKGDRKTLKTIWKYSKYSPMVSLFEICLPYMPNFVLKICLWASKKNIV